MLQRVSELSRRLCTGPSHPVRDRGPAAMLPTGSRVRNGEWVFFTADVENLLEKFSWNGR